MRDRGSCGTDGTEGMPSASKLMYAALCGSASCRAAGRGRGWKSTQPTAKQTTKYWRGDPLPGLALRGMCLHPNHAAPRRSSEHRFAKDLPEEQQGRRGRAGLGGGGPTESCRCRTRSCAGACQRKPRGALAAPSRCRSVIGPEGVTAMAQRAKAVTPALALRRGWHLRSATLSCARGERRGQLQPRSSIPLPSARRNRRGERRSCECDIMTLPFPGPLHYIPCLAALRAPAR